MQLWDVSWSDYQRLLEIRGERASPRITFLKGTLEIKTPSRSHVAIKSAIGRLVEVWCLEHAVEFSTYGSWTIESKEVERGAEPDECYVFGETTDPLRPDLAIEVVWTSGGLNKLDVYRMLGVREVWIWRRGRIQVHVLRGDSYESVAGSEVLPGIDLDQLVSFVSEATTSRAMRAYRGALRTRE